ITNDILINLQETKEDTDLDYLKEHVPNAFSRALDGIDRVCSIVSAMKAFSHPQDERSPIDINKAITTTLSVARNEYKYHANVTTNFAEIPLVMAFGGDINQVFLNLIVNAAHAIESVTQANDKLGQITIKTSQKNNTIVISISDTGCGIPEPIQHRIFDPFFTTKEVGRGTGQGLSLIHTIIVDKHGGNIRFDTKINQGTTFYITLPINAESTLKIRRKT
ncbi:MAG: GHKL domain-containing protein, partial [Methylococcales bacterium]|nr:GHKL domain-containing protein [Methylococcales bacterium]